MRNRNRKYSVRKFNDIHFRRKNRVLDICNLSDSECEAVRNGKPVNFKNTLILDGTFLYGYTHNGVRYYTDAAMLDAVAQYEWYTDKDGEIVTDDMPIRKTVRMAALVYALCGGNAAVWCVDKDGNAELDLTMLKYFR